MSELHGRSRCRWWRRRRLQCKHRHTTRRSHLLFKRATSGRRSCRTCSQCRKARQAACSNQVGLAAVCHCIRKGVGELSVWPAAPW